MRTFKFKLISLIIGFLISLLVLEALLSVYNPFFFSIRGAKFLPPTNIKHTFKNSKISGVDQEIIVSKNSLGFRGDEPPVNFGSYLTILTVGGSTTECMFNTDGKDWPNLLSKNLNKFFPNVWVNNAGFNGHSTFGHILVMKDSVSMIKPKVVLFLVGVNDVADASWSVKGMNTPRQWDKKQLIENKNKVYSGKLEQLLFDFGEYSELSALFASYFRYRSALANGVISKEFGDVGHRDYFPKRTLDIEDTAVEVVLSRHKELFLESYADRLQSVVDISKNNNIIPIFITQPALYGRGIDPSNRVNLEKMQLSVGVNGRLAWDVLQLYNATTKKIGEKNDVMVIDLALLLPKDSKYYYDPIHYTDLGSREVSYILSEKLSEYFVKNQIWLPKE